MQLKGVFYAEFDNVMGPRIVSQAPQNCLSADHFEAISDYIITGKQLCGKLITVSALGLKVMGYPLCIANKKYDRNALLFNVGFVFYADAVINPYRSALRKLARTLYSMEVEDEFLFDPSKKRRLEEIIPRILSGLNERGECTMLLNDANILALKLFWAPKDPGEVPDHAVPILIRHHDLLLGLDCDLALQQVIPHIDGSKYAKRISLDADVDIDIVKRCLRTLLYYNCIALADIFQYSNVYNVTEKLHTLVTSQALQQRCIESVCRRGHRRRTADELIRLYNCFQPGITVQDIAIAQGLVMDTVDHRRLVTFGMVYGLLRRIHRYPISNRSPGSSSSPGPLSSSKHDAHEGEDPSQLAAQQRVEVQRRMDGSASEDELCCYFMLDYDSLISLATSDGVTQVTTVYK